MNVVFNYNSWWNWADYPNQKVVFDGLNKIIYVSEGVTELDVKTDLYSAWKEWNVASTEAPEPRVWPKAFTAIGGDPISDSQNLGTTYFLENNWRIQPFPSKSSYLLTVIGNIYTREGDSPFLFAEGVSVSLTRSNIVDLITIEGVSAAITEQDYINMAQYVWDKSLSEIISSDTTGELLKKLLTKTQYLALK